MNTSSLQTETDPDLDQKVADALKHSWVYYLPKPLWSYAQLARWERPIGWQLLLWPCWWSAMLALLHLGYYSPTTNLGYNRDTLIALLPERLWQLLPVLALVLLPYLIGAFLMRGAGCTYNDLVDVDIDNQVARTRSRPLPSGRASKNRAVMFLVLQALGGLAILLFLTFSGLVASFAENRLLVFVTGTASLLLVAIYPFMKRVTWWPQLFLGLAFSWGALMAWVAIWQEIMLAPVLLYIGSIFWVIGYDTIYAHQDREDDALVGVKSTARLFGEKSKLAIAVLYMLALLFMAAAWWEAIPLDKDLVHWPAWLGLALGALQMIWQIWRLDIHDGDQCLRLFKSNHRFGMILFAGLLVALFLTPFGLDLHWQ